MTKLIVTPIDMSAPGSFALRKKVFRALAALEEGRDSGSVVRMMAAMEAVEAMLRDHLETDDDTTVEEALEMCSAEEFDALISGLFGRETVPNPKSAS